MSMRKVTRERSGDLVPAGWNDPDVLRDAVQAVLDIEQSEVKAGKGSNKEGTKSLHVAAREGDTSAARALINAKAEVDQKQVKDGITPLMFAASWGHIEVAQLLLDSGADVNCVSHARDSALMFAASNNHAQMVKQLIDRGALVNHQAEGTESALLLAASKGNTAVVNALVHGKADVNIRSKAAVIPLHYAARMGHTEAVKTLLESKAEVEARQSENQWTSLMDAAYQGACSVVKVLVDHGADPNAVSKTGRNALQIAESAKQSEVVALLQPLTATSTEAAGGGGCKCAVQ